MKTMVNEYAAIGHTIESFSRLSKNWQLFLNELKSARKLDHETQKLLWGLFSKYEIEINYDIFAYIKDGDSIEMWTEELTLMMALGKVAKSCSYTIEDLRNDTWENLFYRPEMSKNEILGCMFESKNTDATTMCNNEWHEVMELKSKHKYKQMIRVKLITPYTFGDDKGFLALVESKPPRLMYDRLRQFALTWFYKTIAP